MSGSVISHREQRRKRGDARSWTARRIGVLVIAAAAIMAASWLTPELNRPVVTTTPRAPQQRAQPMAPPAPAELTTVDAAIDLAGPPPPRPERRRPRRTDVPLNANADIEPAGYEILSADELEGISQARD